MSRSIFVQGVCKIMSLYWVFIYWQQMSVSSLDKIENWMLEVEGTLVLMCL